MIAKILAAAAGAGIALTPIGAAMILACVVYKMSQGEDIVEAIKGCLGMI